MSLPLPSTAWHALVCLMVSITHQSRHEVVLCIELFGIIEKLFVIDLQQTHISNESSILRFAINATYMIPT
jgi:hypothetical protein